MLRQHEQTESDVTIAVREVPMEEASRFGIMNTREDGTIYEFEEKPKKPKSNKASMGIYIFRWSVLKAFLEADEADPNSENDFGNNIIPAILAAGHKLTAYNFEGYWKDVGTISSLWEANMETLGDEPAFDLSNRTGPRIYARNSALPSTYMGQTAVVSNSFVAEGCEVYGRVEHSVMSAGVVLGEGASVYDSVIMPGVTIENGAVIRHAIVGEGVTIGAGSRVGETQTCAVQDMQIAVIGKDQIIAPGTVIAAGDVV
jgi:glucose-1-phosphate adenylyltransferase